MWHSNHVKLPLPEPDVTLVVDAQGLVVHGEARFAINLTAWHTPVRRRGPLPCSLRPHASDASTPPKCWPLLTRAPPPHPPKLSADPTKSLLQVDDLVMSVGGAPWEPSKLPAIRSGGITVHIQRLTPYVYTKVPKQKRKQAPRPVQAAKKARRSPGPSPWPEPTDDWATVQGPGGMLIPMHPGDVPGMPPPPPPPPPPLPPPLSPNLQPNPARSAWPVRPAVPGKAAS